MNKALGSNPSIWGHVEGDLVLFSHQTERKLTICKYIEELGKHPARVERKSKSDHIYT